MLLQVDLYSRDRSGSFHVAPHGHHLCIWLAQRVKSVQSITFHRFTVRLRCAVTIAPLPGSTLRTNNCLAVPFRHMAAVTHASFCSCRAIKSS